MASIILPSRWTKQPQVAVELAKSSVSFASPIRSVGFTKYGSAPTIITPGGLATDHTTWTNYWSTPSPVTYLTNFHIDATVWVGDGTPPLATATILCTGAVHGYEDSPRFWLHLYRDGDYYKPRLYAQTGGYYTGTVNLARNKSHRIIAGAGADGKPYLRYAGYSQTAGTALSAGDWPVTTVGAGTAAGGAIIQHINISPESTYGDDLENPWQIFKPKKQVIYSFSSGITVQTLFVVTYPAGGGTPSDVQIVAGQNASGAAASWAGNAEWTGSGQYLEATGLSASTEYDSAAVIYDGTAYSNIVEISGVWITLTTLELANIINTTIIESPDLIVSDFSFLLSSLVPSEINSSGGRLTLN